MPHSCPTRRSSDLGDEFETAISRDDRRPAVDPRGAAADDALIAAIADADADRRSFGELGVGAAAQPARAHGDLGPVCPLVPRADLARSEEPRVGKECVSTCSTRWDT